MMREIETIRLIINQEVMNIEGIIFQSIIKLLEIPIRAPDMRIKIIAVNIESIILITKNQMIDSIIILIIISLLIQEIIQIEKVLIYYRNYSIVFIYSLIQISMIAYQPLIKINLTLKIEIIIIKEIIIEVNIIMILIIKE